MGQVGIGRQDLGFTDAAVDVPGEDELVVAQNITQRNRGAAEEAPAKIVAGVADRGGDLLRYRTHLGSAEHHQVGPAGRR